MRKNISDIQKNINYGEISVMSQNNKPIQYIDCDELISIDTPEPTITSEIINQINLGLIKPERKLFVIGPIYINGIVAGDIIRIAIHSIRLKSMGKAWYGNWIGLLKDEVTKGHIEEFEIIDDNIIINNMKIQAKPMIGTIGIAPKEDISCLSSGIHGGNMDLPTFTVGSKLYLKTQVDGALLSLGDVHALMGYGEVLGTGIEVGSTVTFSVQKVTHIFFNYPLHETATYFEIIMSNQLLIDAIKEVTRLAIDFIAFFNKCGFCEAYIIVGELCDLKITQVVNPLYTVLIHIPKSILNSKELHLWI